LVWGPVVIYLALVQRYTAATLLFCWCAGVVGTVDNLLRPRLVGRDTEMSDLMVLLSTLGGIVLFGALGIVVGPLVGALFITVWDLYGAAFKDVLPKPDILPSILPGPPTGTPEPWHPSWTASDLPGQTPLPPSSRGGEGAPPIATHLVPRMPVRGETTRAEPPAPPTPKLDTPEPPSEKTMR
jgi:hypothetical protein